MNTPFDSDTLAAAEVCFAVASQLLYLEPEIAPGGRAGRKPSVRERSLWRR